MEEIVDEIYAEVKHVEPMVAGRDRLPSTAFFLLYKLFTFKLTKRQMNGQERTATAVEHELRKLQATHTRTRMRTHICTGEKRS